MADRKPAKKLKASKGFTAEERAAMRSVLGELKSAASKEAGGERRAREDR